MVSAKKNAAAIVPPFVDSDIEDIKNDKSFNPSKHGTEFFVDVPDHPDMSRLYKLENGDVRYVHTLLDDKVVTDPFIKPQKADKKKKAELVEDVLEKEELKASESDAEEHVKAKSKSKAKAKIESDVEEAPKAKSKSKAKTVHESDAEEDPKPKTKISK